MELGEPNVKMMASKLRCKLRVVVYVNHMPAKDVQVDIVGGRSDKTNKEGYVVFEELDPGEMQVTMQGGQVWAGRLYPGDVRNVVVVMPVELLRTCVHRGGGR